MTKIHFELNAGRSSRSSRGGRSGRGRSPVAAEPLPDDIERLSELKGHTKKITSLVLDSPSGQLFTGGHDGTIRVWSCVTGECTNTVQVGGDVDSMLLEGGFLFVGVKTPAGQGIIKAWNMATTAEIPLEGHTGRVQCLAAAGGMLFSGGQDQTIRVWKPNASTGTFECAAVLRGEQDGHSSSISSLCASGSILFSGDAQGNVKVWDLTTGQAKQTVEKAHSETNHPAIMSMLVWEGHLITGSLDGYIKVWEPADPSTGMLLNPVPTFCYPDDATSSPADKSYTYRNGRGRGGRTSSRGGSSRGDLPGVLALAGVADGAGKAILMTAYNGDPAIRLLELPSFADRGALTVGSNVRAMGGLHSAGLIFSGDEMGRVKVWRWKPTAALGTAAPAGGQMVSHGA